MSVTLDAHLDRLRAAVEAIDIKPRPHSPPELIGVPEALRLIEELRLEILGVRDAQIASVRPDVPAWKLRPIGPHADSLEPPKVHQGLTSSGTL